VNERPPLPAALVGRRTDASYVVSDVAANSSPMFISMMRQSAAKLLTKTRRRRIATNVAKLPELLRKS